MRISDWSSDVCSSDLIIHNVLFDAVDRMDSPFAKTLLGHCTVGGYDYNPDKAKKLLAEAGASNISITMGTPRGRYTQDFQASQAIASFLRKAGIKVQVKTMDRSEEHTSELQSLMRIT